MHGDMIYPLAQARLVEDGNVHLWVVDDCPLCGRRHTHGGGPVGGDPRRLLGHRVAHCIEDIEPGGYILVEASEGSENDPLYNRNSRIGGPATTQMFTDWLMKQKKRQDPVGDLARDVDADSTWPAGAIPAELYDYLEMRGACDGALEALKRAWHEWRVSIGALTAGQWVRMLRWMLDDYRQRFPEDKRGDLELVTSLMDHFVSSGLIEKRNGKYVLPNILEDRPEVPWL